MIEVDVISDYDEFLRLKTSWNDLLRKQAANDIVFLTHEWFECWWKCYAKNAGLFIVVARQNGSLAGIVPMMICNTYHRGVPVRMLSFIENGNSLHNDFIIDKSQKQSIMPAIMDYIYDKQNKWDMVEINNIPMDSFNVDELREVLRSDRGLSVETKGLDSPYIRIESDWETYLKGRSSKSRKTLRNIQNRFKKQGEYSIERIEDIEGYEKVKSQLYEVARESWTEDIGDSLNSEINKQFFDELSYAVAEPGWLVIWLLHLNGEPIAFEYHLRYNGTLHALRASHKEAYSSISPGVFLDYHIMENVFESGIIHEYDLGGSADFYKRKWTKYHRNHINVHIFKKSIYSTLLHMYEYRLVPLVKHLVRRKKGIEA